MQLDVCNLSDYNIDLMIFYFGNWQSTITGITVYLLMNSCFYITTTIASTTNIQRNRQINVGRRAVKGAKTNKNKRYINISKEEK